MRRALCLLLALAVLLLSGCDYIVIENSEHTQTIRRVTPSPTQKPSAFNPFD